MFTWVGNQFNTVLSTYVLGVVSSLMTAIAPIALTCMTIWVTLYGWAVLRNEVSETLPVFMWKVFKIGLVLAFALQSGFYISNVADTANALATGVATTFLPAAADPMTVTPPYALLDAFNDQASLLVLDLLKEAGIMRLDLVFAAVVTAFGNVIFLCIALFVVTLAKLFLTFVIAVGPLFVLCLAWRPTARFFDSWLSMVLNCRGADLVRLLRTGPEHLHGSGHGAGRSSHRAASSARPSTSSARASYCVVDDPHGHHLLPGSEPRLRAHRRCRRPARHPDDPERHDGLRPSLGFRRRAPVPAGGWRCRPSRCRPAPRRWPATGAAADARAATRRNHGRGCRRRGPPRLRRRPDRRLQARRPARPSVVTQPVEGASR